CVLLVITIPLAIATIVFGVFDPHGKRVYRINQFWTWLILRLGGISLNVTGLENVEPREQYVFMVNHQSNVDIPVLIQSLLRFQLRWIAKQELLKVPLFGWAMWATKHITVDRSARLGVVQSLERAKRRLAAGISIVVFPEGTRSRDGRLLPFKKGGFLLAAKARTKIVPVTIIDSARLLPAGVWRLQPGTIEVFVDKPVPTENYHAGKLRPLIDQVRQIIETRLAQSGCAGAAASERSTSGNERLPDLLTPRRHGNA
ncbi:MAG TPA: lysophospholipid acyltransferase family protein, partial [Candidatus Binatia bacterium]|nr:lysophospholipid acyltransferase family protein [Candidatus Binatia bacterium]